MIGSPRRLIDEVRIQGDGGLCSARVLPGLAFLFFVLVRTHVSSQLALQARILQQLAAVSFPQEPGVRPVHKDAGAVSVARVKPMTRHDVVKIHQLLVQLFAVTLHNVRQPQAVELARLVDVQVRLHHQVVELRMLQPAGLQRCPPAPRRASPECPPRLPRAVEHRAVV